MSYATPISSLCDNCTFAYHLEGGRVLVDGKDFRQRYCAILGMGTSPFNGYISVRGYSSCPTNLPKDLPDSAERDTKCIAIQIHGAHPEKTAEEAIAEAVASLELRASPEMVEKFLAALVQVKESVVSIPLTRSAP